VLERLLTWSEGERLDGVLHLPGAGRWPCVIAAHGLLSAKASDKYLLLATHLTKAGFACLRFDFRGCGESGGHLKDTTVTGRIRDLKAILAHLQDHPALDGRFFLLGSSLGGYVALFVAAGAPQVLAIALWATPVHLRDLQPRKEALMAHGLGTVFFREIAEGTCAEVPSGVPRCLIIHGEKDELIPHCHARALYERANEPKVLEIMSGADHRFSDSQHREEAVRLSIGWFKRYL
jgi:uncharacterized protein